MEKLISESVSSLKTLLTGFGRNEEARKHYLKERQRFIRELNQSGIFPPRELLERGTLHEIQAWPRPGWMTRSSWPASSGGTTTRRRGRSLSLFCAR